MMFEVFGYSDSLGKINHVFDSKNTIMLFLILMDQTLGINIIQSPCPCVSRLGLKVQRTGLYLLGSNWHFCFNADASEEGIHVTDWDQYYKTFFAVIEVL